MNTRITLIGMLLALSIFAVTVGAQSQSAQTYWHTSDYYTIQMDGIGNGFVSAEMNLQSISTTPVSNITLEIPYSNVTVYRVVSSYQVYQPCPYCAYPQYYYNNTLKFDNYTTTSSGNSTILRIKLGRQLVNNSQQIVYLFFSKRGLAQKNFQGYSFQFRTIIDNNALIQEAYASVQVPDNMYLKGKPKFNETFSASSAIGALSAATSATALQTVVPALLTYPYYYSQYHASNLLPGEYFTVSGLYGSSQILLYLPEIVLAIIILIVAVLLFRAFLWQRIKRLFSSKGTNPTKKDFSMARATLVGMLSGFVFLLVYYGLRVLWSLLQYSYYYYSSPLSILLLLISLIISGFALFGLPYRLCYKVNKREGIAAGIISVIASIIYLIVIISLLSPPLVFPAAL